MDPLIALMIIGLLLIVGSIFYYFRARGGLSPEERPEALNSEGFRFEFSKELAPETPPELRREEQYYVSPTYGDTYISIMAKDPYWLYAYWEASPRGREEALAKLGPGSRPALRVYDITSGAGAFGYFDIDVGEQADNWYIHVGRPDHTFYAELGYRSPAGDFQALARSNTVSTPRDQPSSLTDEAWPPLQVPEGLPSPGSPVAGPPGSPWFTTGR